MVKLILQWLVQAFYTLSLRELAEAVSINLADTFLDFDNVATDPEDLVALCGSLVVVERSHSPPLVSLAHYSVEEYLCSEDIAQDPEVAFFHVDYRTAHLQLAKVCIRYLSFEDFADNLSRGALWPIPDVEQLIKHYALLEYAARNWPSHLKNAFLSSAEFRHQVAPMLSWFCSPNVNGYHYAIWQSVFHMYCSHNEEDYCDNQPPLYNAIVLGLEHVLDVLLVRDLHAINKRFLGGWTPLMAACVAHQPRIAEILLAAGADPNVTAGTVIRKGLSPLHIAAEECLESTVNLLLMHGANVHARSTSKTTPFWRAARGGSLSILRALRDAGSDINARTWDGWTPLIEAVTRNHVEIARQLLEWGADTSLATRNGRTPYKIAVRLLRTEIAGLLSQYAPMGEAQVDHFDNELSYLVQTGDTSDDESECLRQMVLAEDVDMTGRREGG